MREYGNGEDGSHYDQRRQRSNTHRNDKDYRKVDKEVDSLVKKHNFREPKFMTLSKTKHQSETDYVNYGFTQGVRPRPDVTVVKS